MSIFQRILKGNYSQFGNFLSLSSVQLLNVLIPLFLFPYLVRSLGQVEYGKSAFVTSLISFFQIFVEFGFNYSGSRLIALAKNNAERSKWFFAIFYAKLLLLLFCFIILLILSQFIIKIHALITMFMVSMLMITGSVFFPIWFFQGMEKMKVTAVVNFTIKLLSLLLICLFVNKPEHTLRYLSINALSFFIPGFIAFFYCIYLFKLQLIKPVWNNIIEVIQESKDLFIANFMIGGYSSLRIFVVGLFSSSQLLGFYSIVERIYTIIQSFPLASLHQALYPKLVKKFNVNKQEVLNFIKKATIYTLIYFIVIVAVFVLLHKMLLFNILHLQFPTNYIPLIILLGVVIITINYNAFNMEYLLISGNNKVYRDIHLMAGLIGPVTLLAFTYIWGTIGCACSVLFTQCIVIISTVRLFKSKLNINIL